MNSMGSVNHLAIIEALVPRRQERHLFNLVRVVKTRAWITENNEALIHVNPEVVQVQVDP